MILHGARFDLHFDCFLFFLNRIFFFFIDMSMPSRTAPAAPVPEDRRTRAISFRHLLPLGQCCVDVDVDSRNLLTPIICSDTR